MKFYMSLTVLLSRIICQIFRKIVEQKSLFQGRFCEQFCLHFWEK